MDDITRLLSFVLSIFESYPYHTLAGAIILLMIGIPKRMVDNSNRSYRK